MSTFLSGSNMNKSFGHLTARLRKQRGWTLSELEKRSGISRSLLSRYERGERGGAARRKTIQSLSRAFEVNSDLFLIAEGRIPDKIYSILCEQYPEQALSSITALAIKFSNDCSKNIEDLSRDLLYRYYKKVGREKFQYPINIEALLFEIYGLRVLGKPFKELNFSVASSDKVCGLLVPDTAKIGNSSFSRVILLNSEVLEKKNGHEIGRFTLAHEAFHQEMWELEKKTQAFNKPKDGNVVYCRIRDLKDNSSDRIESKANRFAAALLMPYKDLLDQAGRLSQPLDFNREAGILQRRYGVTKTALRIRLEEIRIGYFVDDSTQLSLW